MEDFSNEETPAGPILDAVQYKEDANAYDNEVTLQEHNALLKKQEEWKQEREDYKKMTKENFIKKFGEREHTRVTNMFSKLGGGRRTCRRKRYRSRTKKRKQKKTKKRR